MEYVLKLIIFFLVLLLKVSAAIDARSLTQFEGLETVLYSPDSGFPYLKINYSESNTERKKVGFLKFGISFLKVKNLTMVLDLGKCNPTLLLSKWSELVESKSIQYANIEAIEVLIIDGKGLRTKLTAEQGKFTSEQQIMLWGNVILKNQTGNQNFKKISITLEHNLKVLKINKHDGFTIELPFSSLDIPK